ncbi:MAG TPA: hypothetical protein VFS21_29140 [Roseiflexaceae bacterium]|nr:hypothetical protein [Roseiflexaceae bacterium]
MSVYAVGAYIETVRTHNRIGVGDVVSAMGKLGVDTTPTYVWRIENGKIASPGAQLLAAMTRAVGGNMEHVTDLLLDRGAGVNEGRALAKRWTESRERQRGLYERRNGYGQLQAGGDVPRDELAEEVTALIGEIEERYAAVETETLHNPHGLFHTLRVVLANWPVVRNA